MLHREPLDTQQKDHLKLIDYLLGWNVRTDKIYRATRGGRQLASPLKRHLNEVNRFLFAGGVVIDVVDADPDDPRQMLLDAVNRGNYLDSLLESIWERVASTGELIILFYPILNDEDRFYQLETYDRSEFYWNSETQSYCIASYASDGYWDLLEVDATEIRWYERLKYWRRDWGSPVQVYEHGYPFIPVAKLRNSISDHSLQGQPEFDRLALDLATEICVAQLDAASNYHFFGNPFFISPDPRETLEALRQRQQVLQGKTNQEEQDVEILDAPKLPPDHPKFVEKLEKELASHLGSAWVPDEPPSDTSSLTLRLLHARSIATAKTKWQLLVNDGLENLQSKLLKASAFDGILASVNPSDPDTYSVRITRATETFDPSPAEMLQQLSVAEALRALGVKPEVALQEFYVGKSEEQIIELLEGV